MMKLEDVICPFVNRLCDTRCFAHYIMVINKEDRHCCLRIVKTEGAD